jgi:4-hydroxy-4-methyl-2-oxoglutarate aldolase
VYDGHLSHPHVGKVYKQILRPNPEHVRLIRATYTGFIVDRMGKYGIVDSQIKPLRQDSVICGPAITVLGPDLATRRAAADIAESGDVLVVAAGDSSFACFGDGTARKMKLAGVQGVVIDGLTRDARRIAALNFPCFCRGTSLSNFDYPVFSKLGAINVPVVCGNALVYPGDLIFGDADGVLVIPRKFVGELADGIQEALLSETIERLALKPGYIFGALEELHQRGYTISEGSFAGE